jgi:hypothetical protein
MDVVVKRSILSFRGSNFGSSALRSPITILTELKRWKISTYRRENRGYGNQTIRIYRSLLQHFQQWPWVTYSVFKCCRNVSLQWRQTIKSLSDACCNSVRGQLVVSWKSGAGFLRPYFCQLQRDYCASRQTGTQCYTAWFTPLVSCPNVDCKFRWGETTSLNCCHYRTYCPSPRWYMSVENDGGMTLTGETEKLGEKPVPMPLYPP